MKKLEKLGLSFTYGDYKQEFFEHKFKQNNIRLILLSGFLTIEQAFYGLFIRKPGTFLQQIHYLSAIILLVFFMTSLYLKLQKYKPLYHSYIYSFIIFGMIVAVYRTLVTDIDSCLPTVFIAVLYGSSVIFYINPLISFLTYFTVNVLLIIYFPMYHPHAFYLSLIEDSIANSILAWIISALNYSNFLKNFINKKIIEKNNIELLFKNKQIEKMNKHLERISVRDPLTDIYNRRKLNEVLKTVYKEASQKKMTYAIILLDVDKFKLINDNYGHKTGDNVLKEISQILTRNIKEPNIVGRWGGEEFMIICPNTHLKEAIQLSEELRITINSHDFYLVDPITASFGVSIYSEDDSIEDSIQKADKALYCAKNRGRNTVVNVC